MVLNSPSRHGCLETKFEYTFCFIIVIHLVEFLVYNSDKLIQVLESSISKLAKFFGQHFPYREIIGAIFFLELPSGVTVILFGVLSGGFVNQFIFL